MEAEDTLELSPRRNFAGGNENSTTCANDLEPGEVDFLQFDLEGLKDEPKGDNQGQGDNVSRDKEGFSAVGEVDKDLVCSSSVVEMNVEVTESITGRNDDMSTGCPIENGHGALEDRYALSSHIMYSKSTSSRKRARTAYDEEQPSVHVVYSSLTRASRQKLEELLQQWSEWHSQHGHSSTDTDDAVESGQQTFFPALHVGGEKPSAVSFWIDHQTRNMQNDAVITLDSNSAPLYDRGYAMGLTVMDGSNTTEGGLEIREDAARCFNCGSYSHSLKECPKPRDNVAVSNARKQHMSKRGQNASSRNSTRYYENSPAGKFDGLQPGILDAETRQLLGLGELDPPPWLNRMRELGYPPGYLDPDDEDETSGITIYADGEVKEECEDGEIIGTEREPKKKMTIKFPGINAPIPKNADERLWAAEASRSESSRYRTYQRPIHSSMPIDRAHHQEHRWSGFVRDDYPPPGCEPGSNTSISWHASASGRFEHSSYESRSGRSPPVRWSPTERSGWSPYEDYVSRNSLPHLSPTRRFSPPAHGSSGYEYSTDRDRDCYDLDYPSERYGHRHGWR